MSPKKIAKDIQENFSKRNLSLALAESCTGGLASAALTEIPGASKYFIGSVVSYANQAKRDLLGVSEKVLCTHGAVSKEAARMMAFGARKVFRTDWALSVTGIAGPAGGTPLKPVGLVFFAVVGPKIVKIEKKRFKGTRKEIQRAATNTALMLLLKNFRNFY